MSRESRAIAEREYSLALYTQRHIDLYGKLLEPRGCKSEETRFKQLQYLKS